MSIKFAGRPLGSACYNRFKLAVRLHTTTMKANIWVMPKPTVLDPQGQTIQHALRSLGYENVQDVRQGKFFVLDLEGLSRGEAEEQVERISRDVLANPVIEQFRFEIVES